MSQRFFACVLLFCPILASCTENPDPALILKKAIEAHGGKKNINKPRTGILKGTNKERESQVTQEEVFDLPKQWKRTTDGMINGKRRIAFNLMIDGKYWEWDEGQEASQTKTVTDSHFGLLFKLVELQERNASLSPLDSIKVQGQSAVGFRATWDGNASDFFMDKKTGLYVQGNFKWQTQAGKDYFTKLLLSDYKEVDGVKFPYHRTYFYKSKDSDDYVLLAEFFVTEVVILDKFPDGSFALPQ